MKFVKKELRLALIALYLLINFTILLHYLRDTACRFETFVANRVGYILEHSSIEEWRQVPNMVNPADLASQWTPKLVSAEKTLWLNEPSLLGQTVEDLPRVNLDHKDISTDEKVRRVTTATVRVHPE